ncbi:MAG: ComF family protein [Wenzhouxiangella sp.]|nr:MAG: ComF family protein [Wenzhouxiangella sp.]
MLYPPVCLVCGLAGRDWVDCCAGCESELRPTGAHCASCGLETARPVDRCGRCLARPPHFDAAFPGFAWHGEVERLVHRFKFNHDLAAGRVLAALLARRLMLMGAPRPDLMVPVPLHYRRRLVRGYNQSEMLCRDLSAHLNGLPWLAALRRRRPTHAQSGLPAARRRGNVRSAFTLRQLPSGTRHIALIDDVMTTGATLDECARVLKAAGVKRVDVWVVARA